MCPHLGLLMRTEPQVATRFGAAEQYKTFRSIFGEECFRVSLVDRAREEPPCAGKAAPLTADERQLDPAALGGVQHIFIFAAFDRAGSLRCLENDAKTAVHYGL